MTARIERLRLCVVLSLFLASAAFLFLPAGGHALPLIVEPPGGSLNGGMEVRIMGAGFLAGVVRVSFAEAPSPRVTVVDDRTLLAVVPPGKVPADAVDIIVETLKERLIIPRAFRYFNDPPIARASPGGKGYKVRRGGALVLDGSESSDPNAPAGDAIALHEWDLDGDGSPDRRGPIVTLTPPEVEALFFTIISADANPEPAPLGLGRVARVMLMVADLHGVRALDFASLDMIEAEPTFPNDDYRDWVGDADRNKIDDAIDGKPDPEKVDTVVLLAHGSDLDAAAARFAPFADSPPVKVPAITGLSLKGITAGDIRNVVGTDPELFRAEEEVLVEADLDVSAAAVRARPSSEYSPGTAHDLGFRGAGVNIAFIDSGIDDDHPALAGKFVAGFNAFSDDVSAPGSQSNPDDDFEFGGFFHGTHVAGVALSADATYGGVAPDAKLIDVKVLDGLGHGTTGTLILGLQWCLNNRSFAWPGETAAHHGIDIVNLSVSAKTRSDGKDSLSMMADAAAAAGLVVVASAGNSAVFGSGFGAPGAADRAITVAGLDDQGTIDRSDDAMLAASNFGPRLDDGDADRIEELKPDVVAPGAGIVTTNGNTAGQPASGFTPLNGSSAATAHAAGVAALFIEAAGATTPDIVKSFIRSTAEPRGSPSTPSLDPTYNVNFGKGIIDAFHALPVDLGNAGTVWIASSADDIVTAVRPDTSAPYASSPGSGSPFAIGGGRAPFGIAVDGGGNVWLANRLSASVTKLSAAGQVRFHLPLGPVYGAAAGSDLGGIAIDAAGDAWLTLTTANQVVRVRSGGGPDPAGYAVGQGPVAVAADRSGNVWIANAASGDVTKLDAAGVEAAGSPFTAGAAPSAIACDRAGRVYVANHGSDDVTILEADGSPVGSFPAGPSPIEIALDFTGRIWVANDFLGTVTRLDANGSNATAFAAGPGPRGITVAGDGTLWIAIHSGGTGSTVARLAPDGTPLETVAVGLSPVNHGDGSGFAHASAVDPDGDADGDGWSNAEEIDAPTNPFDATRHPVEITAVVPPAGTVNGGNVVRIEGRGLELPIAIAIGGKPAVVLGAAPGLAQVIAPAGSFPPAGAVNITATRPGGTAFTLPGAYTYLNDVPVADPDPDHPNDGYRIDVGDPLVLDGTDSADPNQPLGDSIASYTWSVNGNTVLGATPTVSAAALAGFGMGSPGTYPLSLTVRDSLGAPGVAATTVTVVGGPVLSYRRADANQDTRVNIADPIFLVQWLFLAGPAPPCREAADVQPDSRTDIADAIRLVNYLFLGGPAPGAPFPACAPAAAPLGCASPVCP
jgi:streptogramin lyase